jgi:radial spoke head protein 4A
MGEDIERVLEYLDTPTEGRDVSIVAHLSETILRIADFGAARPLDYLEPFSYQVKEAREQPQSQEIEELLSLQIKRCPDFISASAARCELERRLFQTQKLTAEGEEEEEDQKEAQPQDEQDEGEEKHPEEEVTNEGEIPNLIGDMRFMNQVGIGLLPRETCLLQKSIERLVTKKPLQGARFWGKVQGAEHDYYICEADFNEGERPQKASEEEDKGENPDAEKIVKVPIEQDGPNTNVYFALPYLGGKWVLLPDVTPQQIVASRSIRQLFTGNLDAPVLAPDGRFDGTEKELLRCLIARIVHSCTLAPKGLYAPEEQVEEDQTLESTAVIIANEEWVGKPITGASHFLHRLPAILPQGRVEFWAPETEEEDKEREKHIERGPPILRPITEDEELPGNIPSWSTKWVLLGISRVFWLRSNAWPGLNIVTSPNADKIVMHYYGWGIKATPPLEWPSLPEPKKKPVPVVEEEEEEEEDKGEKKEKNPEEEEQAESEDLPTRKKAGAAPPKEAPASDGDESGTYGDSTYDGD